MYKVMPNSICNNVIIIGCGGTGSRLINLISQFLNSMDFLAKAGLNIYLVDNDIVEEKNLLRQNFTKNDVNKHKAQVMAQRYSKAYEVTIEPIIERIEYNTYSKADSRFAELIRNMAGAGQAPLIIMCVDSPKARRAIVYNLIVSRLNQGLLIDTGNEDTFGQVKVMNLGNRMRPNSSNGVSLLKKHANIERDLKGLQVPEVISLPYIPMDLEYFASMTAQTTASCADLDQTMAINNLMAAWAFAYVQDWTFARPIRSHQMVIELSSGAQPQYLDSKYLEKIHRTLSSAAQAIAEEANKDGEKASSYFLDYMSSVPIDIPLMEADKAYEEMKQAIRKAEAEAEEKARKDAEILEKARKEAEEKTRLAREKAEGKSKSTVKTEAEKAAMKLGRTEVAVEAETKTPAKRRKKEVAPEETTPVAEVVEQPTVVHAA